MRKIGITPASISLLLLLLHCRGITPVVLVGAEEAVFMFRPKRCGELPNRQRVTKETAYERRDVHNDTEGLHKQAERRRGGEHWGGGRG